MDWGGLNSGIHLSALGALCGERTGGHFCHRGHRAHGEEKWDWGGLNSGIHPQAGNQELRKGAGNAIPEFLSSRFNNCEEQLFRPNKRKNTQRGFAALLRPSPCHHFSLRLSVSGAKKVLALKLSPAEAQGRGGSVSGVTFQMRTGIGPLSPRPPRSCLAGRGDGGRKAVRQCVGTSVRYSASAQVNSSCRVFVVNKTR